MENSGNLKYPSWPVLLTNPSAANLNVFKNPVTNLIELVLPTLGKSIPLGTNTYVSVSLPNIATKKVGGIDLTGVYPASDVNYEYGFTIEMLRKQPGVDNNEYWPLMFHLYDKMNTILPPASGEVDIQNSDQLTMITNLLAQANASQVGEEYNLPDLLEVGYKFNITIDLASPVTLVFGSTSIVVTTINNLVINTAGVTFVITGNSSAVWSGVLMVPYSVGAPADATTLTAITKYGIYFKSKTEIWDWNVKIDEFQWAEHEFSYIIYHAISSLVPYHRISFGAANSSGVSTLDAKTASYDTNRKLSDAINTLAIPGVSSFYVASQCTTIYATVPMTVYPLADSTIVTNKAMGLPPAGVTEYASMSSKTVWKQLTADQVFKAFAHMQNLGELSVLTRGDQPADEEYVKIAIVHKGHVHASMHSASGYGHGEQRLYIYMPKTKFFKKIYDVQSNLNTALSAGDKNDVGMLLVAATTRNTGYGYANAVGSFADYISAWDPS